MFHEGIFVNELDDRGAGGAALAGRTGHQIWLNLVDVSRRLANSKVNLRKARASPISSVKYSIPRDMSSVVDLAKLEPSRLQWDFMIHGYGRDTEDKYKLYRTSWYREKSTRR